MSKLNEKNVRFIMDCAEVEGHILATCIAQPEVFPYLKKALGTEVVDFMASPDVRSSDVYRWVVPDYERVWNFICNTHLNGGEGTLKIIGELSFFNAGEKGRREIIECAKLLMRKQNDRASSLSSAEPVPMNG